MTSLQNRFKKVYTKSGVCPQPILAGKLILTDTRLLTCKMDIGSSCGIDDDIGAFAVDEKNNIWYSKLSDLIEGRKTVYRFDFNELNVRTNGVIDKQGGFIYRENDVIYRESKNGEKRVVGDIDAIKELMANDDLLKYLTVERIDHAVSFNIAEGYSNEELLDDLVDIYSWVTVLGGEAQRGKNLCGVAAELILRIFRLCSCCKQRSKRDIVSELRDRVKRKII